MKQRVVLLAVLVLALSVGSVYADGLKNFLNQFVNHMKATDQAYGQVGKNLGKNLKEGGLKGMLQGMCTDMVAADAAVEVERKKTVEAFKVAVRDIIMFIPDTIKKIWGKFVGILKNLVGGGGSPQAPKSSFSAKSSDTDSGNAMDTFLREQNLGTRLAAYVEYQRALKGLKNDVGNYMRKSETAIAAEEKVSAGDVTKGKAELKEKVVASEEIAENMEDILAKEIHANGDEGLKVYEVFRKNVGRDIRYSVLPSLNMKVLQLRK